MNEQTIINAYRAYRSARHALYKASQALTEAKIELAEKERQLRKDGLIVGKNETERKDCQRELTQPQAQLVEDIEVRERYARENYDEAKSVIEELDLRMRLRELETFTGELQI